MDESSVRAVGWARSLPMNTGPKAARDWAREHLETLEWTRDTPQTVNDVLLTVSELVTNAHVHAHSTARLVLTWDGQCLHVAVHDDDTTLPTPREPSHDRPGGRGMFLVDALADDWEARSCPTGKSVTACFRPPEAAGDTR
ncbi:ATP-binding protein [Streptomyces cyaneogriseus subsp. noncyanogenus]|uniref:ATP-binding protein n=1 Tax=Streptomyces cyaneogriseus subsp. noncyanogenus TaxID=477245 RepID=A0A0C5G9Z5_9ACTN|nr:ATP-binding protein [Streptomyces cyaneogriseus]AJP05149.1 ATP-binding protein [Streptomyces cyaneogriseus subsp. noncyanogenus]